jgi:hypothetical protein
MTRLRSECKQAIGPVFGPVKAVDEVVAPVSPPCNGAAVSERTSRSFVRTQNCLEFSWALLIAEPLSPVIVAGLLRQLMPR